MKQRFAVALLLAVALVAVAGVAYAGMGNYWEPTIYVNGTQVDIWGAAAGDPDKVITLTVYTPPGATVVVDESSLDVTGDGVDDFVLRLRTGKAGEIRVTNSGKGPGIKIDIGGDGTFEGEGLGNVRIAF